MNARGVAGKQKRSGWHEGARRKLAGKMQPDVVPTRWDTLLAELGLSDDDAVRELLVGSARGKQLQRFARRHCTQRYVPEPVLTWLGLTGKVEASKTLDLEWLHAQPKYRPAGGRR
jgi:hypothetical protein